VADSKGVELPSSRFNDIEEGGEGEEEEEDGLESQSQTPSQTPTHRHSHGENGGKTKKHVNLNMKGEGGREGGREGGSVGCQWQACLSFFLSSHPPYFAATFLHLLGDALGSFSIIISGLIIRYGEPVLGRERWEGAREGRRERGKRTEEKIDVNHTFRVSPLPPSPPPSLQSCRILLNFTPKGLNLASLRQELLALPHVLDVHALHVWTPSSGAEASPPSLPPSLPPSCKRPCT